MTPPDESPDVTIARLQQEHKREQQHLSNQYEADVHRVRRQADIDEQRVWATVLGILGSFCIFALLIGHAIGWRYSAEVEDSRARRAEANLRFAERVCP